jgi:hypothetical protein
MRPLSDKNVWTLYFQNKYAYFFIAFIIGLLVSILSPVTFLGNDAKYAWIPIIGFSFGVLATGPYCWYVCSQMQNEIEREANPPT